MAQNRQIYPGPFDTSLLHLQRHHVSEHIWNGEQDRVMRCRGGKHRMDTPSIVPDGIRDHLKDAGFLGVAEISPIMLDHELVSALIERWRPETHTFHVPVGECTITLQDVSCLLGLPVDGFAVTGCACPPPGYDWYGLCQELFGVRPEYSDFNGNRLKVRYIHRNFKHYDQHTDTPENMIRYARAFIFMLMGCIIFPDHSGTYLPLRCLPLLRDLKVCGTYSWGSACLAYLYREMCKGTNYKSKEIGGSLVLLQLWAWERFSCISPANLPKATTGVPFGARYKVGLRSNFRARSWNIRQYRDRLDRMTNDEVKWDPYTANFNMLPDYCIRDMHLWRAVVPLIHFHIIEWHQPDRVLRQFCMSQHIPLAPLQPENLHDLTMAGKEATNWADQHKMYVDLWDERLDRIYDGQPTMEFSLGSSSQYMVWYKRHTRLWISRDAATSGFAQDILEELFHVAREPKVRSRVGTALQALGATSRVTIPSQPASKVAHEFPTPPPPTNIGAGRKEGRGLRRRRTEVVHEPLVLPHAPSQPTDGTYYVPSQNQGFNFRQYSYPEGQPRASMSSTPMAYPMFPQYPIGAYAPPYPQPRHPYFIPTSAPYIPTFATPPAPGQFHGGYFVSPMAFSGMEIPGVSSSQHQ